MTPTGPRRRFPVLVILALAAASLGHVNSPHIYLEESIGPYPAIVIAHMPPAVPGEIELHVRLADRDDADDVAIRVREIPPQGEEFAAGWIEAQRSDVDPDFYVSPVPLVLFGLWHIEIEATGERGTGVLRFPVPARIPVPRRMTPILLTSLLGLLGLVFVTEWQLVAGLAREGAAPSGTVPDARDRRRGRLAAAVAVATLVGVLALVGVQWAYLHRQYDLKGGTALRGEVLVGNGPAVAGKALDIELRLADRRGNPPQDIAPDHGKRMHLVLVERPGAESMAHVHPVMPLPGVFRFRFRPPRPGTYALFADILHATGESETVTATLEVAGTAPDRPAVPVASDPDDSFATHAPVGQLDAARESLLDDDLILRWIAPQGPLRRGEFYKLDFELVDGDGSPVAAIEPYLGVAGRMLVLREDFGVFTHNHPTGTIGGRMEMLLREGAVDTSAQGIAELPPRVTFPYGFPYAGRYRLWVQMKHAGRVHTGAFDVTVE